MLRIVLVFLFLSVACAQAAIQDYPSYVLLDQELSYLKKTDRQAYENASKTLEKDPGWKEYQKAKTLIRKGTEVEIPDPSETVKTLERKLSQRLSSEEAYLKELPKRLADELAKTKEEEARKALADTLKDQLKQVMPPEDYRTVSSTVDAVARNAESVDDLKDAISSCEDKFLLEKLRNELVKQSNAEKVLEAVKEKDGQTLTDAVIDEVLARDPNYAKIQQLKENLKKLEAKGATKEEIVNILIADQPELAYLKKDLEKLTVEEAVDRVLSENPAYKPLYDVKNELEKLKGQHLDAEALAKDFLSQQFPEYKDIINIDSTKNLSEEVLNEVMKKNPIANSQTLNDLMNAKFDIENLDSYVQEALKTSLAVDLPDEVLKLIEDSTPEKIEDLVDAKVEEYIKKGLTQAELESVKGLIAQDITKEILNNLAENDLDAIKNTVMDSIESTVVSTISDELKSSIMQTVDSSIKDAVSQAVLNSTVNQLVQTSLKNVVSDVIQNSITNAVQSSIETMVSSVVQNAVSNTVKQALNQVNPTNIPFGPGILLFSGCTKPKPFPCDPVCTCRHGCGSLTLAWLCGGCNCWSLNPVYLPTTVILPLVETDYKTNEGGLSSTTIVSGNYVSYTYDPEDVLEEAYGIKPRFCHGDPDGKDTISYTEPQWQADPKRKYLRTFKELTTVQKLRGHKISSLEARFLADSWGILLHALDDMGMLDKEIHIGLSPFTSKCEKPKYDNLKLIKEAEGTWDSLNVFLNKYKKTIVPLFLMRKPLALHDFRPVHSIKGKPIFYVFEKYKCCIDFDTLH